MKLDHRTTIACRYIEGMKVELVSYKNIFPNIDHALHQALAIANSVIPYNYPIYVIETKNGFEVTEKVSPENKIVAVVL